MKFLIDSSGGFMYMVTSSPTYEVWNRRYYSPLFSGLTTIHMYVMNYERERKLGGHIFGEYIC